MENILLRFCRETQKQTPNAIAAHLDINVRSYQEIETGEILLSRKQAHQLGKLFHVKADYFFQAALQLDLLHTKNEIIKIQKGKIEELKQQLLHSKKSVGNKEATIINKPATHSC
jgi:DNA-binding XRE family transcriptional regulator